MKRLAFFLFLPFACAAQGVKLNQYDVFLKQQRIELEPVTLLSSPSARLSVTFSSLASDCFIQVSGSGWGATTIDEGDELHFVFANDSTAVATSIGLQTFEPGITQSTYKHLYHISEAALRALSRNELTGLRKFSFKESSDVRIPRELGSRLQKPIALFLAELKKAGNTKRLKQINASDVAGHIGDSVQFCSKVYNTRYNAAAENGTTVLEMQANFSSPIVNVVIAPEDRAKFGSTPEVVYLNKDVCVSGVLLLRNDTPTLVAHIKEQVKLNPSAGSETIKQ